MSAHAITEAAASAPDAFIMTMKPGCRGDPRMNRAVAAKLKNPTISLYDALEMGGFTYPRNVDAATMDNDCVTLGQRKNQLNRRLRLARRQQKDAAKKPGKGVANGGGITSKKPAVHGASPLVIANSYLRRRTNKVSPKSASKRSAPVKMEPPRAKKQCLEKAVQPFTAVSSLQTVPSGGTSVTLSNAAHQTIQRDVGMASPMCDDGSVLTLPSSNATSLVATGKPPHQDDPWWPATTAGFFGNSPNKDEAGHNLVVADFASGCIGQAFQGNGDNKRTVSSNSFASTDEPNVAGPNSQFPEAIIADEAVGDFLIEEDICGSTHREELGLRIFHCGLQELYKKSMMAAGFNASEASEASQTFHQFAFQAWKNECERLQVLLKDHVVDEPSGQAGP